MKGRSGAFISSFIFRIIKFGVLLCICQPTVQSEERKSILQPVDLGWTLDNTTQYWWSGIPFSLIKEEAVETEKGWYASNRFCSSEHVGTHIDAPYHFYRQGYTVDQIPLDRLFATGITIDVSKKRKHDPDFQLLVDHVEEWEKTYGRIPEKSVVLINFGWAQNYKDTNKYFGYVAPLNASEPPEMHFPGIHPNVAKAFVERRIYGVGLDTPSLDLGKAKDGPTHRILFAKNIYGLENLANLDLLPATGFQLIILPMKIAGGTGAPCRVVASPLQTSGSSSLVSSKMSFIGLSIIFSIVLYSN